MPPTVIRPYHTQEPDDVYQISGFPAERAQIRTINNHPDITVPLVIYNTVPSENADNTTEELLISYGESAITDRGLESMPHPGGISGGGIWYIPPVDTSKVWSPLEHPLVGIVTQYHRQSHQIFGLRLAQWLNLVLTDHPELNEYIATLLVN